MRTSGLLLAHTLTDRRTNAVSCIIGDGIVSRGLLFEDTPLVEVFLQLTWTLWLEGLVFVSKPHTSWPLFSPYILYYGDTTTCSFFSKSTLSDCVVSHSLETFIANTIQRVPDMDSQSGFLVVLVMAVAVFQGMFRITIRFDVLLGSFEETVVI